MYINGETRVCGLMGNPIAHTLSPLIHNTLAERMGHNLVYVPYPVAEDKVKEAVQGAFALDVQGMNVTVPYKSAVMPYLESIDSLAAKIGAVNTLVRGSTGYKGYNTDMEGLYRAMRSEGIQIEGEDVLLLGAGGAARAVAFLCAEKGAKTVRILNRSVEKAKQLAAEVNQTLETDSVIGMALEEYQKLPQKRFLAIQSTSVGLHPHTERAVISEKSFYDRIHTGFDLIYKPERTQFMAYTEDSGGRAYNGLKMLLYQAVIAYELWNNITIPEEEIQLLTIRLKEACVTDEK